ncbi:S8 family serine peptidase [Candidatus Woesearchaeota archaeon]|nr:S8 family serine peptidase [Candidatus Woesearchaeota archaeon]
MNRALKFAKRACFASLAVLLVLLAVSFLPFGSNGSGGERAVNEKSKLMIQLQELNNLPPAVDVKLEPAVKDEIKEALYLAAAAKSPKEAAEKGKVEVLVKAVSEDAGKEIKKAGGEVLNVVDSVDKTAKYFAVKADADRVAAIAAGNDVESISQRGEFYPTLDSSVPVIKADSFWNAGYKGNGVRVAVLDTGIDKAHPMLKNKVVAEKDFSNSGSAADDCGHGTHVAGIVAGSKANGGTYDGVAPGAQLINAKVLNLDSNGKCGGYVDYIIAAIGWALDPDGNSATDDGAKVISMSLGGKGETSASLESELKAAVAKGVVVVVSSGNCGSGCPSFDCGSFRGVTWPGNSPSVITVGAVDDAKKVACFSSGENVKNVGIKPDFAAPGVDVTSSVPGSGYESMKGTSMAAPHVSGAVALMLSKNPSLKQDDAKRVLEKTSLDLGDVGKDTSYGFGLIDLAKALIYKEGLVFDVKLENPVISGNVQKISVTVHDDVQVKSVKATVTKPDGAKTSEFTFASSGNSYSYDFSDTAKLGSYVVEGAINYGGSAGGSNIDAGSPTDTPSVTAYFTASFKVTSLTGDFGNVEGISIGQQQKLSSNLTGTVTFANTASIELIFSAVLQLLDNGTLMQEIRPQPVTIAANSKATSAVNNALEVSPGNYTLRILTDYGAGSLVNETNITLADDLAPQVFGIDYRKSLKVNDAQVIVLQLYEHQEVSASLRLDKHDGQLIKPIITNYTTKTTSEFGNNKTIAITIYNGSDLIGGEALNEGSGYTVTLQLCDESGNCFGSLSAPKNDAEFSITGCSGKRVLVAKTYDSASVFEEAAAADGGICLSVLNKSVSGTPPSSYLEKFDAVVWSTGTDLVNIDGSDAAVLADYYGKKGKVVVEGSDVAFRHGSDSFMRDVLHSELKTDLGFTVSSVADMSSLSINVTRPHPVVTGLGSSLFFNATIDPFPDSVQPYNGSVELAAWSGLDAKGSAIVAYESDDGKVKSLLLPFSMEALNATAAKTLATSVLGWLLAESPADIEPAAISHGVLVDGQAAAIGIGISATTGSQWVQVKMGIVALVDDKVVSQAEVDMPSAGSYSHNFTAALSAGQHVLKAVANSNFSVKESNYVNNVKDFSITVYQKLPDLVLSKLAYRYDDAKSAIIANLSASNFGGTAVSSSLKVYLDGKEAVQQGIELGAGETKQLTLEMLSGKGAYLLNAVIDPGNDVGEHNETNNQLQQRIYICSKEKVLVVDDNDAAFFSTPEPSSSNEFLDVLRNAGYCAETWDAKQQGSPGGSDLSGFKAVIWTAGDYFNGTISNSDALVIGNFSGGLLLEGADVGLDNAGSGLLQSIAAAAFSSDMLLNDSQNETLVLKQHAITANITNISISKEKSPYPDAVEVIDGDVVAEWQNGKAAITAGSKGRKVAYFAFSVDGVNEESRDFLILNSVEWLLLNSPAGFSNPIANLTTNENETVQFKLEPYDAEGDPLEMEILMHQRNDPMWYGPAYFGAVFNQTSGVFNWTPKFDQSGEYTFRIDLVENYISQFEGRILRRLMNVTVNDVNRPPVIVSPGDIEPLAVKVTMNEGQTKNFSVVATDPDGDPLTYKWLLNGTLVSDKYYFAFSPKYNESGSYNLTVIVSDGQAEARAELLVTVLDVNRPAAIKGLLVSSPIKKKAGKK